MRLNKQNLASHATELVLITVVAIFALTTKGFFNGGNWANIAAQSVPILLLAVGQTAAMLTGGLDLSQGAAVGVFSVLLVTSANHGGSTAAPFVLVAAAILLGLINAFVVMKLRNAFVATFAMMYVLTGAVIYATDGTPISEMPEDMRKLFEIVGSKSWLGLPASLWLSLVPLAAATFLLGRTRPGLNLYAWGSNPEAARIHGIREFSTLWLAYGCSALGSALAASVLSARVMQGNPQMGEGLLFESIAACVIGGVALTGGIGGVWAAVRGVLLLMVIQNGLYLLNLNSHVRDVCVGALIAASVLITRTLIRN